MSASIHEVLMSLGDWQLDLDLSPDVLDELHIDATNLDLAADYYNHIQIYWGQSLIWTAPILRRTPSRSGLSIGGFSPEWWLGKDSSGPIIEDRRYIAGTNKLSNPGFDLDDLYWTLSEQTKWSIGNGAAVLTDDLGKDDVLQSAETWEALPGDVFKVSCSITQYSLNVGRLRLRGECEGKFDPVSLIFNGGFEQGGVHWVQGPSFTIATDPTNARSGTGVAVATPVAQPQFITDPSFETRTDWGSAPHIEIANDPTNAYSGSNVLRVGPIPKPQVLLNPSFESGSTNWATAAEIPIVTDAPNARTGTHVMRVGPIPQPQVVQNPSFEPGFTGLDDWLVNGNWTDISTEHHTGTHCAHCAPDPTSSQSLNQPGGSTGILLTPGIEYELVGYVKADAATDGPIAISGGLTAAPGGGVVDKVSAEVSPEAATTWTRAASTFTADADKPYIFVGPNLSPFSTGGWSVDDITLTQVSGNRETSISTPGLTLIAGQEYECSGFVKAGTGLVSGAVTLRVVLSGGSTIVLNEARHDKSDDSNWTRLSVQFTPDTGMTTCHVAIAAEDVFGGSFYVDDLALEQTNNNKDRFSSTRSYAVVAGTTYDLAALVKSDPAVTNGEVAIGVVLHGAGLPDQEVAANTATTAGAWTNVLTTITPPDGYTTATPFIGGTDIYGGSFYVDLISLTQTSNNRDSIQGPTAIVTPERPYQFIGTVRSGAALRRGTVKFMTLLQGSGRPDQIVESSPMEATANVWKLLTYDVTPPSGYDLATPFVVSTDIEGDNFYVDNVAFTLTDKAAVVFDAVTSGTAPTSLSQEFTVPPGSERVRVEVVGEQGGAGWAVDNVSITRVGTPVTTAEIVADCLVNPRTGLPLLAPGVIDGGDTILFDLHILNQTNRDLLQHIARAGAALPPREYRINPDLTLDFGTAETLYVKRDFVLTDDDLILLDEPKTQETVEDEVQRVKLIGADRLRPNGNPGDVLKITAEATAPASGIGLDYFGNPVDRSRIVADSKVDHVAFGQAYAAYQLSLDKRKASTTHQLSDWTTLGKFSVGDWIKVFDPLSGLMDPENETDHEGNTIWPKSVRALSRVWRLGSGDFTALLRRPDGTTVDITSAVLWETATTADVELGDFYPEFVDDPQGPSAGDQFLAFRASTRR